MQWTQSMEQALPWHQDCNDLMFYVVFKGLKVCMTYNNRKINHIYLGVCFSQQFWSFWCQVDGLFHWAGPLLLYQVNNFLYPRCHS